MPSIEQLQEMLRKEPDDVFLNYSLAMVLKREGRGDEALRRFDRCLELDENYIPAFFQKAQFLTALGEEGDARKVLEEGIERAKATGDEHARGEMEEYLETL